MMGSLIGEYPTNEKSYTTTNSVPMDTRWRPLPFAFLLLSCMILYTSAVLCCFEAKNGHSMSTPACVPDWSFLYS